MSEPWCPRSRSRIIALGTVVLLATAAVSPSAAAEPATVAVLPLQFDGDLVAADHDVLGQRLELGLRRPQLNLVGSAQVDRVLPHEGVGPCDAACRRKVGAHLKARYLAGGQINGKHDYFTIRLFLADGRTGEQLVEVVRRCDICGVIELANSMELAASELGSKLEAIPLVPGQLKVETRPVGAVLFVDGRSVGKSPSRVALAAGRHEIRAEAPGYDPEGRKVSIKDGETRSLQLVLQAERKAASFRPESSWRKRWGWIALGTGIAAGVAGGVLLGFDGQEADCAVGEVRVERCSNSRDTALGGWIAVGAGAALVGSGLYLLLSGVDSERAQVALSTRHNGLLLSGTF